MYKMLYLGLNLGLNFDNMSKPEIIIFWLLFCRTLTQALLNLDIKSASTSTFTLFSGGTLQGKSQRII